MIRNQESSGKEDGPIAQRILNMMIRLCEESRGDQAFPVFLMSNKSLSDLLRGVLQRLNGSSDPDGSVRKWEENFDDFRNQFFEVMETGPRAVLGEKEILVMTENKAATLMKAWPPAPIFSTQSLPRSSSGSQSNPPAGATP